MREPSQAFEPGLQMCINMKLDILNTALPHYFIPADLQGFKVTHDPETEALLRAVDGLMDAVKALSVGTPEPSSHSYHYTPEVSCDEKHCLIGTPHIHHRNGSYSVRTFHPSKEQI